MKTYKAPHIWVWAEIALGAQEREQKGIEGLQHPRATSTIAVENADAGQPQSGNF